MKPIRRFALVLLAAGLGLASVSGTAFAREGGGDRGFHGGGGFRGGGGGFRGDREYRGGGGYHVYHAAPYRPFFYGAGVYGSFYYPWYSPVYETPYYGGGYYYPPAVVTVPAEPPTYIEQQPSPAQANGAEGADGYWYWCPDSRTYYPYVSECASQWQRVVPQAPGAQGQPAAPQSSVPGQPVVPKQ